MSLKAVGLIDIPDSAGTSFDHGAFEAEVVAFLWPTRHVTVSR
jgi:hypothetical protein